MKQIVQAADLPCTLGQFIQTAWKFSNRMVRHLKAYEGSLRVNHQHRTVRYYLQEGDVVQIYFPPEVRGEALIAEQMSIDIVYEDDDVLIVNKPAGIPISPSADHPSGTLANGIIHYYDQQALPYTIHMVTRLDRDTSGLVFIAKHRYMHALCNDMLEENAIRRSYEAIIVGVMSKDEGTIDMPIGRKDGSIIERTVDFSRGKRAITHYRVYKRTEALSYVKVQLETGRTHQIRVHFSALGNPLLGDTLYGEQANDLDRQALHCSHLSFIHPFTKKTVSCTAPIPDDMRLL